MMMMMCEHMCVWFFRKKTSQLFENTNQINNSITTTIKSSSPSDLKEKKQYLQYNDQCLIL